jgi:hypothetical protein
LLMSINRLPDALSVQKLDSGLVFASHLLQNRIKSAPTREVANATLTIFKISQSYLAKEQISDRYAGSV